MHVAHREEQDRIERDGQVVSENLFYMKQCVRKGFHNFSNLSVLNFRL